MYRFAILAITLGLASCSTGPEYETRASGAFPPTMPVAQAEAECRAEGQRAVAGEQDFGRIYAISRAVYASCLEARGYQMVEAGST